MVGLRGGGRGKGGPSGGMSKPQRALSLSFSRFLSSPPLLSFLPVALGPIVDKWEFNSIRARLLLPLHGRVCGAPPPIYRWVHAR